VQRERRSVYCNVAPLRATPIYSVLSLSSPPLRAGRRLYFAFDSCSLVPRAQKAKWVGTCRNVLKISCTSAHRPNLKAISRSGEVAALVISLSTGLSTRTVRHSLGDFGSPFSFFSPITNHISPLTASLAVPSYWINHCLTHVAHRGHSRNAQSALLLPP